MRPYRMGTSSGTRVPACSSSRVTGSTRYGEGLHSAWLSSGAWVRTALPMDTRSSTVKCSTLGRELATKFAICALRTSGGGVTSGIWTISASATGVGAVGASCRTTGATGFLARALADCFFLFLPAIKTPGRSRSEERIIIAIPRLYESGTQARQLDSDESPVRLKVVAGQIARPRAGYGGASEAAAASPPWRVSAVRRRVCPDIRTMVVPSIRLKELLGGTSSEGLRGTRS